MDIIKEVKTNEEKMLYIPAWHDKFIGGLDVVEFKLYYSLCAVIFRTKNKKVRIKISSLVDGYTNEDGSVVNHGSGLSEKTVRKCLKALEKYKIINVEKLESDNSYDAPFYSFAKNIKQVDVEGLRARLQENSEREKEKMKKVRKGGIKKDNAEN